MKYFLNKILDRFFVVLGALIFLQFPLFIHQYQQQLIGHVHELQWQIDAMQERAIKSEKNVFQYIQKFIDHSDEDFSHQGVTMKQIYNRFCILSKSLKQLESSSSFTRPFIFLFYIQWDIFKSTTDSFEPGLIFTKEALLYALLGMLLGYFLFYILRMVFNKIFYCIKLLITKQL